MSAIQVPFLDVAVIEERAELLLAGFFGGGSPHFPIPVDDIVEHHLNLTLDYDDLAACLFPGGELNLGGSATGHPPTILGATFVKGRSIFIDQSLVPGDHPGQEGRYRLTVAHEVGHWELHRPDDPSASQAPLFNEKEENPLVLCRSDRHQAWAEWQATKFATILLMPTSVVKEEWQRRFRSPAPITYRLDEGHARWWLRSQMNEVARLFTPFFGTSVEAMRIRLEELGLLTLQGQLDLGRGSPGG